MEIVLAFFVLSIVAFVYFIPTICAFSRGHHNRWPIAILNFFLGGTCIGWVIALVWAWTKVED
jgi:hypothetical protein